MNLGRDHLPGGMADEEPSDGIVVGQAAAAQLEHEARYGREMAQRLDELMRLHREGHQIVYQDLVDLRGDV